MKKTPIARNLYLIFRGPQSEHHKAPFHPVILCTKLHTAKWEARGTDEGATVLENMAPDSACGNWLLVKYKGYNVDYGGGSVRCLDLFDGKSSRDISKIEDDVLKNAIWWSWERPPVWLAELGVRHAKDAFTKKRIYEDSGTCVLQEAKSMKIHNKRKEYEIPEWLK